MKRGSVRGVYLDSNKKNDFSEKKRRPSRIEERIRARRLKMNKILQKVKSPDSADYRALSTTAECKNSSSSKTINSAGSSRGSNSGENLAKIRDSKQRVDLFEIRAPNRTAFINTRSRKSKGKSKVFEDKLSLLFPPGRRKFNTKPKSAPCTPLFEIKRDVNNFDSREGEDNFIDFKIVEKDCIKGAPENVEIIDDLKPLGNPALISVMTESLDKIQAAANFKSSKSRERMNKGKELGGENLDSTPNAEFRVKNVEIGGNSEGEKPELELESKIAGSLNSGSEGGERCDELRGKLSSDFNEDDREELNPRCTNAHRRCKKPLIKSRTYKWETSMEKCRVNSDPRDLIGAENHGNINEPCYSEPTEDQAVKNRGDCRCGNNDSVDFSAEIITGEEITRNRDSHSCKKSKCFNCSSSNCKTLKIPVSQNPAPRFSDLRASLNSCDPIKKTSKNFTEKPPRSRSRCFFGTNHPRVCAVCNRRDTSPNNFESESTAEIRCDDCDSGRVDSAVKKPIIQSREKMENSDITSRGIFKSCNCTNRGVKCCGQVIGQRSKSSPRKVRFFLPSLVPEETNSCRDNRGGDKPSENEDNRCICNCGRSCSGAKRLQEKYSNKFDKVSSGNFNSFHGLNREWRCRVRNESRERRVDHFCKEIITKHQAIVRGDLFHKEISRDSVSKTSLTSDKDWADDDFDQSFNFSQNISFPKETRQAMNVLMQSRENTTTQQPGENLHGSIPGLRARPQKPLTQAKVLDKPDFGIFDSAGHKAMHVATYAQALAVFQRTCDPLAGGSSKKKRQIVWKGSDGEIHSEYTSASEYTLEKLLKRGKNNRRRRNRYLKFLHNFDKNQDERISNVPELLTGRTMQTNGSDNGSSENGVDRTGWTVGLINGRFKYLTAETFGFKINANGASLKKKQLWTLEGSEHQVFLRSHLDRYLAVDQFGNVTCEAEDTADPGCAFQIQVASDGSGRWALKNIQRGYFLGSSQDELKCTAKVPGDAEYWLVHLAARPQVNLRSAGRKRFAHLSAAQDEIHVDAPVPWGEDTLFTLEFRPAAMPDAVDGNGDVRREVRSEAGIGGHYALHTCNNKYLARDGKLLDSCTRDCLYAAEFHAGMLALRDISGAYLAPIGSKAVLKSRSNTVTRDELFSLEDSLPQASFVAALNQRYVSVKQGVDVTANQDEISGHETFQLEFDRATKRWYLRTMQDRYWTLEAGGGIQASDHKRSSNALFDLVWQPADGTVALRANNGKFLATKRSGHLYANADSPGDSEASKFYFYLMNRPVLVLRCEQGFVGLKSNASPKLECNKASYETIRVERCDRGIVRFKGQNGKYWHADSEGVTSDADVPADGFYLELREPSRICIKSTDGRYLSAGKNGVFRLGDTDYESATKWEF